MQFTDYFYYKDDVSHNELQANENEPTGHLKLNFRWKNKLPGIIYDVEFLLRPDSIFVSVWIDTFPTSKSFKHEFAFHCSMNRTEYTEKFNNLNAQMSPIDAYFDVIEEEYINKIIDGNGGLQTIFRETLKKVLG